MDSDEEEDVLESSIHDLDHAPPPPVHWRRGGATASLSPRSSSRRRTFTTGSLTAGNNIPGNRPRSMSSNSSASLPTRPLSPLSSLDLAHVKSFPPDSGDYPAAAAAAAAANDRRVSFTAGREGQPQRAMQHIPEDSLGGVEESKDEEDPFKRDITYIPSDSQFTSHSEVVDDSWEEDEEEENDDESSSGAQRRRRPPKKILGVVLPEWCSKRPVSWDRVAICVANQAPCFCCIQLQHSTYRAVLVRLNILCAFFAIVQIVSGVWLYIVLQNPKIVDRTLLDTTTTDVKTENQTSFEVLTNVWNLNGAILFLGALAIIVLLTIMCTVRAVRNVALSGTIRYLWIILWVIPLQIYFIIALFDYFGVTSVWIQFWWRDKTMAWFRNQYCVPSETANGKCAVPVFGTRAEEDAWCMENYQNAIDCVPIRNNAQIVTQRALYVFYYANAAWAIVFVFLLFLAVRTLESIISRPLVQKSRQNNMPVYLLLPIFVCAAMGALYAFSTNSALNAQTKARIEATWIGPMFLITGGLFLLAALLAWFLRSFTILNITDKFWKKIVSLVLIGISTLLIVDLTVVFSACIAFSISLGENEIDDQYRGSVACFIDQSGSCTGCGEDNVRQCPEWETEDVTRILQTQAKSGAALAAIFLIYAAGSLRYGFIMRRHIINYQIDYV